MNQRVITEHLTRVGLNIEIAENGREGIDRVRSRMDKGIKPFDLILMDIHMPVMDGMEATPKIIELGTETPIVAMTANIIAEDRERYIAAGMIDYLGKPFTSQELWRCLLKFLKPTGFTDASSRFSAESGKEDNEQKLQTELKTYFVKSCQTRFDEIKNAVTDGDINLAHRIAHTLKSNAALIGKTVLQQAAAEVEAALKDGENRATETQMNALRTELSAVLDELSPYLEERENPERSGASAAGLEADKANEVLEKLLPLLESGNVECLNMINTLRTIPGSAGLIAQMEDFNFRTAAEMLVELSTKLRE